MSQWIPCQNFLKNQHHSWHLKTTSGHNKKSGTSKNHVITGSTLTTWKQCSKRNIMLSMLNFIFGCPCIEVHLIVCFQLNVWKQTCFSHHHEKDWYEDYHLSDPLPKQLEWKKGNGHVGILCGNWWIHWSQHICHESKSFNEQFDVYMGMLIWMPAQEVSQALTWEGKQGLQRVVYKDTRNAIIHQPVSVLVLRKSFWLPMWSCSNIWSSSSDETSTAIQYIFFSIQSSAFNVIILKQVCSTWWTTCFSTGDPFYRRFELKRQIVRVFNLIPFKFWCKFWLFGASNICQNGKMDNIVLWAEVIQSRILSPTNQNLPECSSYSWGFSGLFGWSWKSSTAENKSESLRRNNMKSSFVAWASEKMTLRFILCLDSTSDQPKNAGQQERQQWSLKVFFLQLFVWCAKIDEPVSGEGASWTEWSPSVFFDVADSLWCEERLFNKFPECMMSIHT